MTTVHDGYGSQISIGGYVVLDGEESSVTPAIGPSVLDIHINARGITHTTTPYFSFVDRYRLVVLVDGVQVASTGDQTFDPGLDEDLDIPLVGTPDSFTDGTHALTAHWLVWNDADGPGTPLVDLTVEEDAIVTLLSVDPLTGPAPLSVQLSGTFPFVPPEGGGS